MKWVCVREREIKREREREREGEREKERERERERERKREIHCGRAESLSVPHSVSQSAGVIIILMSEIVIRDEITKMA